MSDASKIYDESTALGQRILEVQSLKSQIEALEDKLDEHKAYLLAHAIRHDLKALKCGAVTLSRRERANWTYSEALRKAEAALKTRKTKEQQDGIAVNRPTESLVVNLSAKILLANAVTVGA
jgi:hypothetical protein